MSLLYYIRKLIEKILVEKLFQFYEKNLKLYKSQMRPQKNRCVIYTIALILDEIHKVREEKKILVMLLMDNKRTFN